MMICRLRFYQKCVCVVLVCMVVCFQFIAINKAHANIDEQPLLAATYNAEKLTGTLVVVNKSDDSVSIIDIKSATIINTLPTGKGPHELVITNDGLWAISTNFVDGNSLTVFDLQAQKVARTIQLDDYPGPHGITILNNQKEVAFTSGKSKHLVFANIHTGEITRSIATQQNTTHMVAISELEDFAYTTNIRSNSISQLDLRDNKIARQISTEQMPEGINITQDGNELWYGSNKDGLVTVINPKTNELLAQFGGFSFPYRVLFSHNEKQALVPDFSNHYLRFFDRESKKELGTLALEKEAGPQGIALHPVEDIAFLSLNLQNKVLAIDINTRQIIKAFPTGNNPDGIVYSSLELKKP